MSFDYIDPQEKALAYRMWKEGYNDREVAQALGWSNTKAWMLRSYGFGIKPVRKWGKEKKSC